LICVKKEKNYDGAKKDETREAGGSGNE